MVKWEGIEDTSPLPTRVWLGRTKLDEDANTTSTTTGPNPEEWKPLRKVDCKRLNSEKAKSAEYGHHPLLIESGRATADPDFGIIRANFVPRPLRELTSCTWFVIMEERKDESGIIKPILQPMPDEQAELVEDFYQKAIFEASVYGDGIEPLLKEKKELGDSCPDYHIEVCKENGAYKMRKVPNGWFGKSFVLQRGHGSYIVEGEEEEEQLGPISHVVFVVHGIGEAYFANDPNMSMVEQMDQYRLTFQKRQIADWKKACDVAKRKKEPTPEPPNRVEFLPILWYDRVHDSSSAMTRSLQSVTLNQIPALRSIANDVVLDVLLYMTPNYCQDVLKSVTDQIYSIYGVFNKTFPDFAGRGGKCSLIGHSLGSVICWDLLSLKKKSLAKEGSKRHSAHLDASTVASNAANTDMEASDMEIETVRSNTTNDFGGGTWGPQLAQDYDTVIPFQPEFTMFVGSPIGLFLSLRGAHAVFDSIRDKHPQKPRVSPFTLPTKAVYNIFSPSDPVAYRIEPLLLAHGTPKDTLPEPMYLTRLGEDVRLHVKAMQLVSFFTVGAKRSSKQVEEKAVEKAASKDPDEGTNKSNSSSNDSNNNNDTLRFPLAGRSTRLDYQLQPNLIDNEYIKAVTAHSTYFQQTDIIDFVIDITEQIDKDEVIDLTIGEDEDEEMSPSLSNIVRKSINETKLLSSRSNSST
eukprot:CAMPEP_0116120120 /NCGR_PEP_ID=MMETSP0329-20121206/3010_1 /TAXON_ID=697910 /ORGANISM="Pseudo-nitzschia arenysensis, Strain B593" /LENGTH=689 /DNA_ID=CAMNT_0003613877 /DNA_START=117 /DNA_END=2189 /DNA_ORIENTATION=+